MLHTTSSSHGFLVSGSRAPMLTITLSCAAGTHAIGVETTSHADSNGLSLSPATEYATSGGRGDAFVARASVLVKATTPDVAAFVAACLRVEHTSRPSVEDLLADPWMRKAGGEHGDARQPVLAWLMKAAAKKLADRIEKM